MVYVLEREIGGKKLTFEIGKLAQQASGAVKIRLGDTIVLVTAVMSRTPRTDIDFLPLTVEFEEKLYAIGKVPGSFFRREGRPSSEAILSARLIDRPMRPQFPKALHNEIQIVVNVLSSDRENPQDILGIIGASAAVSISDIPFNGPVGACRIAYLNGDFIVNPTFQEIEESDLNVTVAGVKGAIVMVEAGSQEVPEEIVLEAIQRAQKVNDEIIEMIEEMVNAIGKPKQEVPTGQSRDELDKKINSIVGGRLSDVLEQAPIRSERSDNVKALEDEVRAALLEEFDVKAVAASFKSLFKHEVRNRILEKGIRPDGRALDEVRPISVEVGELPRAHGTGLFTRGETQVLSIATLASLSMSQKLDTLSPGDTKRYMHHYNFPAFSVGETGRMFTGRREIGHGALAERAIESVMPSEEEFPYVIRVVSEVLSSNGSTSMASVCGSSLALMDAGVPLKAPVAGVAMGLIMGNDGKHAVLTDIQGMEDFLGDMDFKVAGTAQGINALQMDIKIEGLTYDILKIALEQARLARIHILDKMNEVISIPRENLSAYAPKMHRMIIPIEKIGAVIGPGGKMIRAIQEETGTSLDIDDKGVVMIGGLDADAIEKARQRVDALTRELQVGDIFTGKVVRETSFGVFVELVPGKDGLLRKEEMASQDKDINVGDEATVVIQEIDNLGRVNLSRRSLFGEESPPRQSGPPRYGSGNRGGGQGRPGGPGRGYGGRGRDSGRDRNPGNSGPSGPRGGSPRGPSGPSGPSSGRRDDRRGGPGGYRSPSSTSGPYRRYNI